MNKRNPKTGYAEYYMDESKKPTDTVSRAGRFGDDRIGIVDDEPSHINAWEEYLLNTHGEVGEEIVKHIGSGTINPETGMMEYGLWDDTFGKNGLGGAIGSAWDNTLGKHGLGGAIGDGFDRGMSAYNDAVDGGAPDVVGWLFGEDSLADWTFGEHSLFGPKGYFFGDSAEEKAQKELEKGLGTAMGSAASTWSDQLKTSLGSEGSIAKEFNLDRKIKGSQIGDEYSKMNQSQAQAQSSSGFATIGQANQQFDFSNANLMTEKSFQDQSKEKSDLLINMEKEMNQMLVDYTSATGEEYTGKAFKTLRSDIDEYQGT